jgi:hypothetical protein
VAIIGILILLLGSGTARIEHLWAAKIQRPLGVLHSGQERGVMNGQLHIQAIDSAVSEALLMFRTKDEFALANWSNACERQFRNSPGTLMLDRCAAFDDAVVGLQNRDPLRDEGPFAALAVTGRQWSSAAILSNDDLAIDSRLDRVRLRVELRLAYLLAPPLQEKPPQRPTALNAGPERAG